MSSPLSMLKKTRRTPLQRPPNEHTDPRKVPFRRNMLKGFQADDGQSSDRGPPLTSHTPANPASTSRSKAPLKKGAPPSDFELMSAMMQRVALLEKTVRSQAEEIEHKDKKISALLEKLRPPREQGRAPDPSDRADVERRCEQLQNRVREMEGFLNDYGLIWVGDSAEAEQPHATDGGLQQPDASRLGSSRVNFDLVLQRVRELNVVAGEGECFVRSTLTGAQLAKKDPIPLSLYSNGMVMFDGPFRSYQEQSAQQCMQDLLDGYFPSELQERFPHGVPFEVQDRRDEEFIFREPWNRFPGEGRAVGGAKEESVKKLRMDQFLSTLPKVVVKAGRVIDIRDSVRDLLQGSSDANSSNSVVLIDTLALQAMKERLQTSSPNRPSSACDVVTLKVRSEDGNRTYILKMAVSESVGALRQYLDRHRGGGGLPGYDIISAYPRRCYGDDLVTLRACGLATNATLLLRKRQRPPSPARSRKTSL